MHNSRVSIRKVVHSIKLVYIPFLIFLMSTINVNAFVRSSLINHSGTSVSFPSVILQTGTVGSTTVYSNNTSAMSTIIAAKNIEDFIDNNSSNLDGIVNRGAHSNFTAQKYGPDSVYDVLTEETEEEEYIWISGNDDYVRKLNKSDPTIEILSWDTGVSYPFSCEYRVEYGNEYIYVVNYAGSSADADYMIKYYADNGTEITRWNIDGYSNYAYGLAWNGSRWFIADGRTVDTIFQVDPADPTTFERSFSYSEIDECHGLAWDGSYLWAVDQGTDKVYQLDIYGNVQTNWTFTDPTGIAYDTNTGHLLITKMNPQYLYEYHTNGTEINSWDPSGTIPLSVSTEQNYFLDLEINFTNVGYEETNEELCISFGTMSSEDIIVDVWNGTDWENLSTNLVSGWNNITVSSYLTAPNLTIRFKDADDTGDVIQDSWNIDATLLHVWTTTSTYDSVIQVNNTVQESWQIRLKQYSDSNIDRLQNCTLYFHNSTDGITSQIMIENGEYDQDVGSWYNLPSKEIIYIVIKSEANSTSKSNIYAYLEILNSTTTSTYIQYVLVFKIK